MKRDGKKLKKQDTKAKKRKVQCENEETKQQRQETVIEVDARGMQLQLQLLTCMKCKEVNFLTSAAHKLSRIYGFSLTEQKSRCFKEANMLNPVVNRIHRVQSFWFI